MRGRSQEILRSAQDDRGDVQDGKGDVQDDRGDVQDDRGEALGLNGIPNVTRLWHILLVLAVALFCFWRLRGSRAGFALEAIRQDETAARATGIDTTTYKVQGFVAGAVLAGIAGALAAHAQYFISAYLYGFRSAVA